MTPRKMGKSRPVRPRAFSLSWANRTSKPATSPARIECFDIFSPAPGDKDVISQVDRLSSKDAKIAGRSVWITVDASVRSAATCMVVSRVGGLATSLCRARRSLSRRPWDLSPHAPCRSPGALTHVTARWIARPPKAIFVTRLRPDQLLDQTARQLPDHRQFSGWNLPPQVIRAVGAHCNNRVDAWRMVQRRAADLGARVRIGCHTFRATGITAYLEAGGTLENAQLMAAHESPRTTKLYDRTGDEITLDEVERGSKVFEAHHERKPETCGDPLLGRGRLQSARRRPHGRSRPEPHRSRRRSRIGCRIERRRRKSPASPSM